MADDDPPALRPEAAAALASFLADREAAATADPHAPDYGLSQFWYTDATADAVAAAVVGALGPAGRVACVSCPSLFKALLRLEAAAAAGAGDCGAGGVGASPAPAPPLARQEEATPAPAPPPTRHALLEFDDRFACLGPFSHYDYRDPAAFAPAFAGAFDAVVADPPYLSAECLERTAVTVGALEKKAGAVRVLLSGAAVRGTAWSALRLKPVAFRPEHSCKLGNEFLCYTDSEAVAGVLGGWDGELGPEEEEGTAGGRRAEG